MNMIPFIKFVAALVFAGVMLFVFFPVMNMIVPFFPEQTSSDAWLILFGIWNGIPVIVLIKETLQLLMSMQRRPL